MNKTDARVNQELRARSESLEFIASVSIGSVMVAGVVFVVGYLIYRKLFVKPAAGEEQPQGEIVFTRF